jgi:hypothetical protein
MAQLLFARRLIGRMPVQALESSWKETGVGKSKKIGRLTNLINAGQGRLIGRTKRLPRTGSGDGMNSKLHADTDATGRPISFFVTAGQVRIPALPNCSMASRNQNGCWVTGAMPRVIQVSWYLPFSGSFASPIRSRSVAS